MVRERVRGRSYGEREGEMEELWRSYGEREGEREELWGEEW